MSKSKIIKPIVLLLSVSALLALILYFSFYTIFNSIWMYVISFFSLLHIICFAFYVVEEDSIARLIIGKISGWFLIVFTGDFWRELKEDWNWGVFFGVLIFSPLILYMGGWSWNCLSCYE